MSCQSQACRASKRQCSQSPFGVSRPILQIIVTLDGAAKNRADHCSTHVETALRTSESHLLAVSDSACGSQNRDDNSTDRLRNKRKHHRHRHHEPSRHARGACRRPRLLFRHPHGRRHPRRSYAPSASPPQLPRRSNKIMPPHPPPPPRPVPLPAPPPPPAPPQSGPPTPTTTWTRTIRTSPPAETPRPGPEPRQHHGDHWQFIWCTHAMQQGVLVCLTDSTYRFVTHVLRPWPLLSSILCHANAVPLVLLDDVAVGGGGWRWWLWWCCLPLLGGGGSDAHKALSGYQYF